MKIIKVLDLFNTSTGLIAMLTFPENEYPKNGMILKRVDGATWKIIGIAMPQLSEMTNDYKHLDPPCLLFNCNVSEQTYDGILKVGDNLNIN
jgi:hypothetical protein